MKARQAWWETFEGRFDRQVEMVRYLDTLTMPASGLWAYARIPKTGTNTVLAALHQLEFGAPVSTEVSEANNTADDSAPHLLDEAGVFMSPLQSLHDPAALDAAFRFTVLRHPVGRARSSYAYLCLSHRMQTRHLAPARLRLSAMTGFDWSRDPARPEGFDRFLDFIAESVTVARLRLDRHLAPQTYTLSRDIFRPHLTGRTEEMRRFLNTLASQFGTELPGALVRQHRNRAPLGQKIPEMTADQRRRCEQVFAADMEWYESA